MEIIVDTRFAEFHLQDQTFAIGLGYLTISAVEVVVARCKYMYSFIIHNDSLSATAELTHNLTH